MNMRGYNPEDASDIKNAAGAVENIVDWFSKVGDAMEEKVAEVAQLEQERDELKEEVEELGEEISNLVEEIGELKAELAARGPELTHVEGLQF